MDGTERPLQVLDLFSGIGGFTLGLERAGMQTVAFCEREPFCREWLAQHWPAIPCHPDVRQLDGRTVRPADIVCGGFPCQDVSAAGKRRGLAGSRSGLWFQMFRIVREVRPTWVIAENVTSLRTNGADRVLCDLERAGYACWPFVVGADDIGFPHRRKRVWIIGRRISTAPLGHTNGAGLERHDGPENVRGIAPPLRPVTASGFRVPAGRGEPQHWWEAQRTITAAECRLGVAADGLQPRLGQTLNTERLKAAGNAIVPFIAEIIGRAVIRTERELGAQVDRKQATV